MAVTTSANRPDEEGKDQSNSSVLLKEVVAASPMTSVSDYTRSSPQLPNPENGYRLHYKPQREHYMAASEADKQRMYGYEYGCSPSTPPVIFFTPQPPCRKEYNNNGSGPTSLESFLREAASTFPNMPSIIRRRQRKTEEEEAVKDVVDEKVSIDYEEEEEKQNNGSNGYYISPPYRIRSKRRAVFKSRQLEFITVEEEKCDDETKSSEKDELLDGKVSQLPS